MSLAECENTKEYAEKIRTAAKFIQERFGEKPADIAIVLGSGLGQFATRFQEKECIEYSKIPNMVQTTVSGHSGTLILGTLPNGKKVITFAGRVHAYEGIRMFEVTFLARLAHALGCKIFIATNAAGGALDEMNPGDAMIITDHVNWQRRNPLQEAFADPGLFPKENSCTEIYSERIAKIAREIAKEIPEFSLREGVYACFPGPSYETVQEIQSCKLCHVGAFGMSTVPECIVAKSLEMEVFALSLCTNLAAGISKIPLCHEEVKEVADKSGPLLMQFMESLLSILSPQEDHNTLQLPSNNQSVTFNVNTKRATTSEINEAAEFIRGKLSNVDFSVAVQLPCQKAEEFTSVQFVKETQEFSTSDIPNYPNIANPGACVIIGENGNGTGVLCFVPKSDSGFLPAEACFLAQLIQELGIQVFFLSVVGGCFEKKNEIIILDDAFDISTMASYPCNSYSSHSLEFACDCQLFDNSIIESFAKIEKGNYFQFPGPSYPTNAEQYFAQVADASFIGITNLQIAYAVKSLGIQVAGIAGATRELPSCSLVANSEEIFKKMNIFLDNCVRNYVTSKYNDEKTVSSSISEYILGHDLRNPVQGDPTLVQELIERLKEFSVQQAFVVYDPYFVELEKQCQQWEVIPVDDSSFSPIFVGDFNGKKTFIIYQNRFYHQGFDFSQITSSVRAVSASGVEKMVILAPFCSVSSSYQVGDIVCVKEQINLTGRSPLYGHQVKGWGKRFPDMSSIWYSLENDSIPKVNVATLIGPILYSPLTARLGLALQADVFSTGVGWETLTIKHMKQEVQILGLGEITSNANKKEKALPASKFQSLIKEAQMFFD